jgi:hypothetical protein
MRSFFRRAPGESPLNATADARPAGKQGVGTAAARLSPADRRRRKRRAAAGRQRDQHALAQEQLEPRLALAVYVAGYENATDAFVGGGVDAPHVTAGVVRGRAVIASDDGSDVFIRQVASVTQDLIVDSNSSFLNYQIIDSIDERFQQIFVTNGTRRVENGPLGPDFITNGSSTFFLNDEEVAFDGVGLLPGIEGTIELVQRDGVVSRWTFGPGLGAGFVNVGPPLGAGHIQPAGLIGIDVDTADPQNFGQSSLVVTWSDPLGPSNRATLVTATYPTSDGVGGLFPWVLRTTTNVPAAAPSLQRGTAQVVQITLPGALATLQDGISNRQSLGIIPGTLRGEAGSISFSWGAGGRIDLPAFRADVNGVLRFNGNSSVNVPAPTGGLIDVRGIVRTDGIVELEFRRWNNTVGVGGGFNYANPIPIAGGPSNLVLTDVDYLTYVREARPNQVTFVSGQTITRELTVDLLAPGSTVNVDSPIRLDASNTYVFAGVDQLPDVDFRATNINIRAAVTSPDRFSVGRSQVSRERLSIPPDGTDAYLLSPSMPSLYGRRPPEPPILPNGGFPQIGTARAVAVIQDFGVPPGPPNGLLIAIEPLPGFQGFGYNPTNPPAVTITGDGGTGAEAEAIVGPDGTITGYLITNPGSGYTGIPVVTVAAPIPQSRATARVAEINAATGQVVRIDVLDPGYRYHAPPLVVVAPPSLTSFGVQATARAILDPEGRIDSILIVNPGEGYSERPVVTIAEPSPPAMAERLIIEAEVRAQVYEIYVGDDFGTQTPRGLALINANGSLSTEAQIVQITSIVPPPFGATPIDQQVILGAAGGGAFPPGFNPLGVVISGFGIREGTRILAWDPVTSTATLPLDSVSSTLPVPLTAALSVRSQSLYLEATQADVIFEGLVNVDKQSYLFNSLPAANYLAPFTFTTRSRATGQQTGTIEGSVVDIVLGNDALPPLTGSTAFHDADLRTRIDSLRVRAASSATNPQGPFPYRLSIEEIDRISLDAVAGSSGPISVSAVNGIRLTSVVDTDGDLSLLARTDQDNKFADLQITAPVRTRFGQIAISADTVEVRNSLAVTAAAVRPGRQDITLEARSGDLLLQGDISAVNDVFLEQVNRVAQVSEVLITAVNPPDTDFLFQTIVLRRADGGGLLPSGFNPVGRQIAITGFGGGTRIEAWDPATGTATVAAGTIFAAPPPAVPATISPAVTTVFPGGIDGNLARVVADELQVIAQGSVSLRTDVNRLTATAGTGFRLSELNDVTIPLLSSGGLVSLEALGVDLGQRGANPVALTAKLLDVTNLVVNTPNGSARIDANTDRELLVGDAAAIQSLGDRAPTMLAAGNVTIRSQAGDVTLLDAPIAGGNARPVRVVTAAALPATSTYLPGNPGVTPSSLSGAGSLNALTTPGGEPFWGLDALGRPLSLAAGDLVLVKDQPSARENGIYRVVGVGGGAFGSQRWQLVRDAASDTAAEMPAGTLVRVLEGPKVGTVFTIGYDSILPTLVERISTNQLQFPELFPNFDLLRVGMIVNGAGIAPDSFISAIDPVARVVTLDVVDPGLVFASGLGSVGVAGTNGDTIALDPGFVANYPFLAVGQEVTGAGIRPGAVITRIDPLTQQIDLATSLIGPTDVSLSGTTLTFDSLFTLFSQLEAGQQVQLLDGEANLLGTRTITAIDPVTRSVTLDAAVLGTPSTARVWTPGALPVVLTGADGVPVFTARPNSVVFNAADRLAGVRAGQLFRFVDAGGVPILGVPPQPVASLTIRLNGSTVVGDVTLGFGTLLTPAQLGLVSAPDTRVEFLPPDAVEFGVAAPNSVPVAWNTWTAANAVTGTILTPSPPPPPPPPNAATMAPSATFFARVGLGDTVDFLSPAGAVLGNATVLGIDSATRLLTFSGVVPAGATQVRAYSRVVTLPNFAAFSDLTRGLEVFGPPTIPPGTTIDAINATARTITLSVSPTGPVSAVSFGLGPSARFPAADTLRLDPAFTNYQRLFVGQRVYGAGIEARAVIVSIDPVAGTIGLTPRSVGTFRGPIGVTQRDSLASPFYPERFDDWLELEHTFNDFSELKIGQRVALLDAAGNLLRIAEVTGVDAQFRTVGLANGSLNGIAADVAEAAFLPPTNVRFGVIDGIGSGLSDLLVLPVGLAPISVTEREVRTNIGSDSTAKTVTFVVSTDGRTNDATGSLGKMIDVSQSNDPTRTQVDLAVIAVTPGAGGTWVLQVDPLFTGYDRLYSSTGPSGVQNPELASEPVFGTPRMFTAAARVVSVNSATRTVTLAAGSLSNLAIEDLNRVTDVTLAIQTVNPDQTEDFRFWQWTTGNIQLLQELPEIRKTMTIDGSRTSSAGGSGPARLGPVFIDGQRIIRTNQGGQVNSGTRIDGLVVAGADADSTRLANLSIGGFQRGSAIRIDAASRVVVENMRVGLSPTGARVPNVRGITVGGAAARDNTILNSTVVGGTSAGIAVEDGAERTYIVGGAVGTPAIDNQIGIFVAEGGRDTFIGTNPILPAQPITASVRLTAGLDSLPLSRTAFATPLIGLGVTGPGIPSGTFIRGVDSAAGVVFLGDATGSPVLLAETRTVTATIGHVASRLADPQGRFNQIELPPFVPLDDVFVGQRITGTGIPANTVITAIDRGTRVVTLSRSFSGIGPATVSFGAPARTVVQRNRTGIVLRGESTRITNTDVADNTLNGIEVVTAGQQIGSPVATGQIGGVGVPLASWPATVSASSGTRTISLGSRFVGRDTDIGIGTPVFGAGIAAGTTVVAFTRTTSGTLASVTLSTPTISPISSGTIGFGVQVGGVVQRVTLAPAEQQRLFVGQNVHADGIPEFTELAAFRIDPVGGGNQYLIVSAPQAGLPVANFSDLAAGQVVFADRTAASNRIYGNGRYGIRVFHDDGATDATGKATRIAANYFGMLAENVEGNPNRLGAVFVTNIDGLGNDGLPSRYESSGLERVDSKANKYGIGDGRSTGGGGSGVDPLPPRDPII